MLRRFWLLFSQTVTILLAIWFIVATLKPEWLHSSREAVFATAPSVSIREVPPGTPRPAAMTSFSEAAQRAMPAVVNIFTSKSAPKRPNPQMQDPWFRFFFGDRMPQQEPSSSLGSGVIVSPEGFILTNHHVIDGADEIEVALADGRKLNAKVVGADPETDLALLKVSLNGLPAITFGQLENVRVGDPVLAIGNPFGVGQTATSGIVSALGRSHLGINIFENFIQTDAAINPGNSGGALVDAQGNLLGINTAIYSRSGGSMGIGFAIPVTTARQVMEALLTHGSVTRGWIGVEPQDITPELAESFSLKQSSGALIAGVMRGGPADRAGVKPGDILIGINDSEISDTTSLLNTVAQLKPDSEATLKVLRRQKTMTLTAQIGKRPAPARREIEEE